MRIIFALFTIFFMQQAMADIQLKTLAQIYNISITEHDLDDRVESLAALSNAQPEQFKEFQERIFQDMIRDEVFLHQAKKLKIKVTEGEIDELIEESEQGRGMSKGAIKELMKKHPAIYNSFKAQVAKNTLIQNFVVPKIIITTEEVEKQKGKSHTTMKFSIAMLHLDQERADKHEATLKLMEQEVGSCDDFKNFIEKHNLPELTFVESKIEDLNDAMKSFVSNFPEGKISEQIQVGDDAYQYLMICSKKNVELAKKTEEEIKAEIYNRKLEIGINNYYLSLIKNAHIVIPNK